MITEDYVSFETAKLLKEKGFDEPCYAYWHEDENRLIISQSMHAIKNITNPCFFGPAAPTLQMAMKWLREVCGLDVDISIEYIPKKTYYYSILKKTVIRDIDCLHSETNFKSYEDACEAAIKYCLEYLM